MASTIENVESVECTARAHLCLVWLVASIICDLGILENLTTRIFDHLDDALDFSKNSVSEVLAEFARNRLARVAKVDRVGPPGAQRDLFRIRIRGWLVEHDRIISGSASGSVGGAR